MNITFYRPYGSAAFYMASLILVAVLVGACASSIQTQPTEKSKAFELESLLTPLAESHLREALHVGKGRFQFRVGRPENPRDLSIYFYRPPTFNQYSKILWVVPGAGRNASSYRDSWVALADTYNVLILSPHYPKKEYDFAGYHLANMVESIRFDQARIQKHDGRINKYFIDDSDLTIGAFRPKQDWLFSDFDTIFKAVVQALDSEQDRYDMFGHSAGARIVHRMAVFYPESLARTMVAANSGAYTMLDPSIEFPFGLARADFENTPNRFAQSLQLRLVIMLGEKDDKNETRGTMLHTPIVDKQGAGRLERGTTFYTHAQEIADSYTVPFNWSLHVVKNVGHEKGKMALAAAEVLYRDNKK